MAGAPLLAQCGACCLASLTVYLELASTGMRLQEVPPWCQPPRTAGWATCQAPPQCPFTEAPPLCPALLESPLLGSVSSSWEGQPYSSAQSIQLPGRTGDPHTITWLTGTEHLWIRYRAENFTCCLNANTRVPLTHAWHSEHASCSVPQILVRF